MCQALKGQVVGLTMLLGSNLPVQRVGPKIYTADKDTTDSSKEAQGRARAKFGSHQDIGINR